MVCVSCKLSRRRFASVPRVESDRNRRHSLVPFDPCFKLSFSNCDLATRYYYCENPLVFSVLICQTSGTNTSKKVAAVYESTATS